LKFNLSHSGDIAAIAIADGRDVGVDVEQVRDMTMLEELASCSLSPGEQAELRKNRADKEEFFRLWTRKEAYLKATSLGLSVPPCDVEISAGWSVINIAPAPGYAGAVAVQGDAARVSIIRPDHAPDRRLKLSMASE
jgi:4'-phosphopantetheinyl transferase